MLTLQVMACIGIITGTFLLFRIRLDDFTGNIFKRLLNGPKGIREEILEETRRKKKSYLRREIEEVQGILVSTDREDLFPAVCTVSLVLFAAGAAIAVMIGNFFLVPVAAAGFMFLPFWYIRLTASHFKRDVSAELETALSIITTAYLRSEDILTSVEENLEYLNPPVKNVFWDFVSRIRLIDPDLEAALDRSHIPVSVYDNLMDAVHKALPQMHRYVELRKKLLGLEELHMYDLYVPMVEDDGQSISFERAKEMVLEGLRPMGEEYLGLLKEGFSSRWIDVYENQGKKSGAYSWGAYGTHPYVLLNYQENLNSVFTLAHEMGHALHSWYSDANQPYIYAGYQIFVAEVASTCNEALLIHHLIETTEEPGQKAYLINYFLEQFRTTLFRQTMFAEFEKITHGMEERGETLTADRLCGIYYGLNQEYFGKNMCVDKEIELEWARIPHFYTPFYVYQYATGFSAAIALSKRILEEGEPAVEEYKSFLKGGSSRYPLDLLRMAGVDMEQKRPVEDALCVFKQYLDEMERLAGNDKV